MAGQPKTFKSGEELIKLFESFCKDIKENGYAELPTQTAFTWYLKEHFKATDRKTIYSSLNRYFPDIKKEFEQLQADTLITGAAKGKYKEASIIFALKNWCKWTDKQEIESRNYNTIGDLDSLTPEERQKRIAELLEK